MVYALRPLTTKRGHIVFKSQTMLNCMGHLSPEATHTHGCARYISICSKRTEDCFTLEFHLSLDPGNFLVSPTGEAGSGSAWCLGEPGRI